MSNDAAHELCGLIETADVPVDELAMVLSTGFERAWIPPGGRDVFYGTDDQEVALQLTYAASGRVGAAVTGPALAEDTATRLVELVGALAAGGDAALVRVTLFSSAPLEGYWRYGDEWQIRTVPPDAPRPPQLYAPHPFTLEATGAVVSDVFVGPMQIQKRLSEIALLLSLVLVGGIQPAGLGYFAWFLVQEPELRTRFGQIGYFLDTAAWPRDSFSAVDDLEPVHEVPAGDYYRFPGVMHDRPLEIPDILRPVVDAFGSSIEPDRERFLRAAYWFDRAAIAWHVSASLSYISLINAIEVLTTSGTFDPCPTCGLNRAPGPTARFRETVERYAGDVVGRDELYRLRSRLVHGGDVLVSDRPTGMAFTPDNVQERQRYDFALPVARAVIIGWLFDTVRS